MIHFFMSLYMVLNPINYDSLVENHVTLTERSKFDNGFKESRYDFIIEKIHETYDPLIADQGGEFRILTDWSDGAVNMWAFRLGNEYWLEVPGGMARYYLINEEAFLTSLCHELGHLLGGSPKNGKISYEGQSDYYATNQCIDLLLESVEQTKPLSEDQEVTSFCRGQNQKEQGPCDRAMQGSKSLTSYYAELEGVSAPLLTTPSQSQVSQTLSKHPPAQCRLDTLKAGFIEVPRPGCWYKP